MSQRCHLKPSRNGNNGAFTASALEVVPFVIVTPDPAFGRSYWSPWSERMKQFSNRSLRNLNEPMTAHPDAPSLKRVIFCKILHYLFSKAPSMNPVRSAWASPYPLGDVALVRTYADFATRNEVRTTLLNLAGLDLRRLTQALAPGGTCAGPMSPAS